MMPIDSLFHHVSLSTGVGSSLTRTGKVQMDAMLIDGKTLRCGGVHGLQGIKNPIKVAVLLKEKVILICWEISLILFDELF